MKKFAWLVMCVAAAGLAQAQNLKLIVPVSAGGALDIVAKAVQNTLVSEGLASNVELSYMVGKGHSVALSHLVSSKGDPNQLMVVSAATVGALIASRSQVFLKDARPIVRLVSSPMVVLVPTSSPIRDLPTLARIFRENPASITWGGGSMGATAYVVGNMLARSTRGDMSGFKFVPSAGQAQAIRAMLQGQLSIVAAEVAVADEFLRQGQVRALGLASANRIAGYDIPTLKEQGHEVIFESWSGIVAPPGISSSDASRLISTFLRMTRSSTWKDHLVKERWLDFYQPGFAFRSFLDREHARMSDILGNLNLE